MDIDKLDFKQIYGAGYIGSNANSSVLTTTSTSNISYTTATVNGAITNTGTADVTERGVCYGTSAYPTTAGSKVREFVGAPYGATTFSESITGLTQTTTYHVRMYAINSVGTNYGEDLSFTTLTSAAAGTPVVSTGSASVTTSPNNQNYDTMTSFFLTALPWISGILLFVCAIWILRGG